MDFDVYVKEKVEHVKQMITEIEEREILIPYLFEMLDEFQHLHCTEETEFIEKILLSYGFEIIPFINLSSKDPGFIHYLAFYFFDKCSDDIIVEIKEELFKQIDRINFSEHCDLYLVEMLLQKNMYNTKIKSILLAKEKITIQHLDCEKGNPHILVSYLEEVRKLLNQC